MVKVFGRRSATIDGLGVGRRTETAHARTRGVGGGAMGIYERGGGEGGRMMAGLCRSRSTPSGEDRLRSRNEGGALSRKDARSGCRARRTEPQARLRNPAFDMFVGAALAAAIA